ncbi:hypothetical protein PTSG_06106 [Salpingoeca rosetta]|uniref:Uncharacterized protein n=1 Tax=Salpingoeca rosetta (strain ATCC 50818 / BSB-021) TaxID=946362 RepID=F2UDP8_SALR5|nr:uncharacterized protein PTSG_06106 [Salpingoeca rosetta]EGD74743.1 hypothetical protein PTSG_06106 [Salpingoeca rosetta]|eukprot:XP_004993000.1 hypothetical protein PTSG_06106 [Salpingoeca rosetta]
MSFGRDCVESGGGGGEYYFTDALGTKWTIPYDQDSLTVQFDPETRRGFAFRPSEGAGSYWYLSLTGATGIACQHFGAEDDAVRSWYLRDATDGGNGYYSTWGVPRGTNVPTMILKMEYAHCSPDDVNQGVCTHPVHLGSCSSYRILCFP